MRYTVVKQFSNQAIDNIFSFAFKWVDCGKMFLEFLWSFLEIWIAFFLIFYNIFMYFYYLFLFFIDRGAESGTTMFRLRGSHSSSSNIPRFEVTKSPVTVPPMYGAGQAVTRAAGAVMTRTAGAATQTLSALKSTADYGAKKSPLKSLMSGLVDFFSALGRMLILPFKKLVLFFDRGVELRKQREAASDKSKSLIDEYIKEYEQKKR